ncbi:MAG TPA: GNAT family N-acetyltransferase [Solirubrobacterales bacterium]
MPPADAPEMTLRPASEADAGRLLEWRNDPDARAASRNIAEVGAAEHTTWLAAVLADPNRQLLICELNDKPVGQVRFDRLGESRYEISVALARAVRGQGLSSSLIALAVEKLRESSPGAKVEAHVREGNDRSLAAFRRAGFRPSDREMDGFLVLMA